MVPHDFYIMRLLISLLCAIVAFGQQARYDLILKGGGRV